MPNTHCARWMTSLLSLILVVFSFPAFSGKSRLVTVEATGVGDSPQTAVTQAAKNGLAQVLGSFMDSQTTIEERYRVEDGRRHYSEDVEIKTRQYSRGMIKEVTRLSVHLLHGIYEARVRITVKVDE